MTTVRVAPTERLTAAKLWLPAMRELEARLPSRVAAICARSGVEGQMLEDPRARISLGAATRLLREATRETRDPLFALVAGRRHARESFDVFMRMLLVQPDLDTAIDVARRFSSLPIEGLEMCILPERDTLRVVMTLDGEPIHDPLLAEYMAGMTAELVRDAGDPRLYLLEVELTHAPRAGRRAYRDALPCDVWFQRARTALLLPNVNIALRQADPLLATLLADHAAIVLGALPSAKSHRDRVAVYVFARLDEPVGIDNVSTAFGMSARTLRRRLEEESTTFAEVLDEARKARALTLLRDDARSIAEVAAAVGFTSAGAFRRAFQRWMGTSARAYRASSSET